MNKFIRIGALCLAMTAGLAISLPEPAFAQAGSSSQFKRDKDRKSSKEKAPNPFPNAKRVEPPQKMSERLNKKLVTAFDAIDGEEYEKAEKLLNEVLADKKVNKLEQANAYQGLGMIASDRDDDPIAQMNQFKKAVEVDALANQGHFGLMLGVAQIALNEEDYETALTYAKRWLAESGAERDSAYQVIALAYYRQEKFAEVAEPAKKAVALAEKPSDSMYQLIVQSYYDRELWADAAREADLILAKKPDLLAVIKLQAQAYLEMEEGEAKAATTLQGAYDRGVLKSENDIRHLASIYSYIDRPLDAVALINNAVAANKLKPSLDTYKVLGDGLRYGDKYVEAAEAYAKAEPFAKDGEILYLKALAFYDADKYPECKQAATAAIAKAGHKQMGETWLTLGNCELGQDNLAGAKAAYTKALGYPNTKESAASWLKSVK